jgi:hypothetical protein
MVTRARKHYDTNYNVTPKTVQQSEKCEPIEFALTVPEIKEIIRNKRKEGWKLPDN